MARRFSNPDLLEKEAEKNALEIIRLLLRDLGPKTASEIKDELCGLVIKEDNWTKWWQGARSKIKKDTMIASPENTRSPFVLRRTALTHEERFHSAIHEKLDINEIIQTTYNFVRDFPDMLKKAEVKSAHLQKL